MENHELFLLLSANNSSPNRQPQEVIRPSRSPTPQAKNSEKFSYGTGATKTNLNNKGMYRY